MHKFYSSFTFMLSFMILVLIFNMLFGPKFTEYFLLLVLLSMVVLNADKFAAVVATDGKPKIGGTGGQTNGTGAGR